MALVKQRMHPTTWATLRALRGGAQLSRNRHFNLFEDPRARRALRMHRYLMSIVADLEANEGELTVTTVEDAEGRYALRLEFPCLHGHRVAFLSELELELLAEDAPAIAELIARKSA